MRPPLGLENSIAPGKVLRLRKAIYGLKQSPQAWYHKLSLTLWDQGFRRSEADHYLPTSLLRALWLLFSMLILIISGDNRAGIECIKSSLKSTLDIKDLRELKYFLGIEVCRCADGILLSQTKYVIDLLNETGLMEAKPAKTPLEDGYNVNREGEKEDEPFEDSGLYRKLVSQQMKAPTKYHWTMVERILRYLRGSLDRGVWMGKNASTEIVAYYGADWAGDRVDRRSTTGYCTFIGGNMVTWKTKKQKVVACSTAETEYRAMRKLTNKLTWLKGLLADLDIDQLGNFSNALVVTLTTG
ncbi:PREDICTED: uncharacterized protein LOC109132941 [Camelina sativa]|uniref:Uncharacterized protein LOC109132941 n=1 Tax=Camelina sativa TaxID=90675 RepID=A0ABM1RPM3_CAMSA|nr:PREDICTED: uncharacterized protein LOC109132941 [Camelina sativa]